MTNDSTHGSDDKIFARLASETETARPGGEVFTPRFIGPYKILETLGEGGMGVVYLAEQEKPMHRRVALKVIKQGMDTKQVIARFEVEREALALMNHSNVARVFDAGMTEEGRPYFAMEHVPGIAITDYCDKHRLNTEDRLRLFIDVCHAIQHAHQKGIIHRDIKPSNILVTAQNDKPVPKVIDFGVAKATQQRLAEQTVFTEQGQLIGTPGYMSPEQAEMTALGIDTRTDVYSLGVLLYELLVGARPFDDQMLRGAGYAGIQRIIREIEPPKPSTRFSSLGADSAEIAHNRRSEPKTFARLLRGDLDWIVMKCLEKDRTRRYDTANVLATDVEHYLCYEAVLAGPPSGLYRFKKLIRRNRISAMAVLAISSALLAGTIVSLRMYLRAERVRIELTQSLQHSVASAREASAQRAQAEAIKTFLTQLLRSADPDVANGRELTVKELLNEAGSRLDIGFRNEPLVEAALRSTIGNALRSLGNWNQAEPNLRRTVELLERARGPNHVQLADALLDLAALLNEQGKISELESVLVRALSIYTSSGDISGWRVAEMRSNLGVVRWRQGQYAEAEALWREVLDFRHAALPPVHDLLATSFSLVATAARCKGDYQEAKTLEEKALAMRRELHGRDHRLVGDSLACLGLILLESGANGEAESCLLEALGIHERLLGPEHPAVAQICNNLAELRLRQARVAEAEAFADRALAIVRSEPSTVDRTDEAYILTTWAEARLASDQPEDAEAALREAVAILQSLLPKDDWNVASTKSVLGECLAAQGRLREAEQLLAESYRTMVASYAGKNAQTIGAAERLANFVRLHSAEEEKPPALDRD